MARRASNRYRYEGDSHIQMKKHPTSEEWVAEVDTIIRRYRSGYVERVGEGSLSREEAIARLRRLGLGYGEAERWLSSPTGSTRTAR